MINNSEGLQEALNRGLAEGGNLRDELNRLGNYVLTSYYDAGILIDAFERFVEQPTPAPEADSNFRELTGLFVSVLETDAFHQLARRGIPLLLDAYDVRVIEPEDRASDLLLALRMFARYGVEEGLDRIVDAAFNSALRDSYLWASVFEFLRDEDPILPKLVRRLSRPLPEGFAQVAFLDWTNRLVRRGTIPKHPFNSPDGIARLRQWLESSDEDDFSFAHSATAAIPFLSPEVREELLELALDHPDINVRLEGAWAAARLEMEKGKRLLVEYSLDHNHSMVARSFLEELGMSDLIPAEADEPQFRALAKLCEWLGQPQQFGRAPDEITLFDTREWHWPPTKDWRRVWLFKYRYHDDDLTEDDDEFDFDDEDETDEVGIGMSGSIPHVLFGETSEDMSPLDIYALHCCWELEEKNDPRAPAERSVAAGRAILASAPQEPPDPLEDFPFDSFPMDDLPRENYSIDNPPPDDLHEEHSSESGDRA